MGFWTPPCSLLCPPAPSPPCGPAAQALGSSSPETGLSARGLRTTRLAPQGLLFSGGPHVLSAHRGSLLSSLLSPRGAKPCKPSSHRLNGDSGGSLPSCKQLCFFPSSRRPAPRPHLSPPRDSLYRAPFLACTSEVLRPLPTQSPLYTWGTCSSSHFWEPKPVITLPGLL